MFCREIREVIWAFFFLSLGGLLLHLRIHPPSENLFNWIPFGFGVLSTLVLPFLFNSRKTVAYAYLFTWASIVAGTVGMIYFSITTWNLAVTVQTLILKSTLADVIILWTKAFLAQKALRFHWPMGVVRRWEGGCAQ